MQQSKSFVSVQAGFAVCLCFVFILFCLCWTLKMSLGGQSSWLNSALCSHILCPQKTAKLCICAPNMSGRRFETLITQPTAAVVNQTLITQPGLILIESKRCFYVQKPDSCFVSMQIAHLSPDLFVSGSAEFVWPQLWVSLCTVNSLEVGM